MEEIVEVAKIVLEEIVDVPVPQFLEESVEVQRSKNRSVHSSQTVVSSNTRVSNKDSQGKH